MQAAQPSCGIFAWRCGGKGSAQLDDDTPLVGRDSSAAAETRLTAEAGTAQIPSSNQVHELQAVHSATCLHLYAARLSHMN